MPHSDSFTDKEIALIVYLSVVQGETNKEIARIICDKSQTYTSASVGRVRQLVSKVLEEHRRHKWDRTINLTRQEWGWVTDARFANLDEEIKAVLKSPVLQNIYVRGSGWKHGAPCPEVTQPDWDERLRVFGNCSASLLDSLLTECAAVGVTWGQTPHAPIRALAGNRRAVAKRDGPLSVYAVNGDMKYLADRRDETSATTLARTLAQAINGDEELAIPLDDVTAFIHRATKIDKVPVVRNHYKGFRNFKSCLDAMERCGPLGV